MNVVGWDLDSTLAHTLHRQHMVPLVKAKQLTWEDYALACPDDGPIPGTIALMRQMPRPLHAIITGRSEAAYGPTWDWLQKHEIPADMLFMRPEGDHTPNGKFKARVIDELRRNGLNVVLFIEDWPEAADYIREHTGVPVLVVNPCYPESAPHQNGGAV